MVKNALADAQAFRRNLQKLVVRQKFHALFKAHLAGVIRRSASSLPEAHIRQLLFLADVNRNVLVFRANPDHHTGIDRNTRPDKQRAAILRVKQAVANGFARFKGNQRACEPAGELRPSWAHSCQTRPQGCLRRAYRSKNSLR